MTERVRQAMQVVVVYILSDTLTQVHWTDPHRDSFKEPLKPLQSEDGPSVAQSAGCEGLRLIFDTEFSFAGGLEQQIYTQEDAGLILQLQYLL